MYDVFGNQVDIFMHPKSVGSVVSYNIYVGGYHCAHLPCFNVETLALICFTPLPFSNISFYFTCTQTTNRYHSFT